MKTELQTAVKKLADASYSHAGVCEQSELRRRKIAEREQALGAELLDDGGNLQKLTDELAQLRREQKLYEQATAASAKIVEQARIEVDRLTQASAEDAAEISRQKLHSELRKFSKKLAAVQRELPTLEALTEDVVQAYSPSPDKDNIGRYYISPSFVRVFLRSIDGYITGAQVDISKLVGDWKL